MKHPFLFLTGCLMIVALASCKKDQSKTNPTPIINQQVAHDTTFVPTGLHTDGFGPSKKALTGSPYILPTGISMSGRIKTNMSSCSSGSFFECVTDGELPYYITLQNSNSTATTVIFPAGLVIPSQDTLYQGGVIVQNDTVIVPASSSICVNLNAFCINHNRVFTSNVPCGSALVTDNDNLTPLIQLLARKRSINYDKDQKLQQAIWHIADSAKMTQEDIDALAQLP